jgi:hypothetical protein
MGAIRVGDGGIKVGTEIIFLFTNDELRVSELDK